MYWERHKQAMAMQESTDRLWKPKCWRDGVLLPDGSANATEDRLLPTLMIWPGFAINTLFYATILGALFAVPAALRRKRRIKRGLCPKCAYPVGTSAVCTECGTPVTSKGTAAQSS